MEGYFIATVAVGGVFVLIGSMLRRAINRRTKSVTVTLHRLGDGVESFDIPDAEFSKVREVLRESESHRRESRKAVGV